MEEMNMRHSTGTALVLAFAIGRLASGAAQQAAPGESPEWRRLEDLNRNRQKLELSVHMDRAVYFPGEDAEVTIRVVNPTATSLEVPEPFHTETGNVNLLKKGPLPLQWVYGNAAAGASGDSIITSAPPRIPPTTWLAPYQKVEKTFWLSEAGCGRSLPFVTPCQLEEAEGEYRLAYN